MGEGLQPTPSARALPASVRNRVVTVHGGGLRRLFGLAIAEFLQGSVRDLAQQGAERLHRVFSEDGSSEKTLAKSGPFFVGRIYKLGECR